MDVDIHCPELLSIEDCWLLIRRIARSGKDDQVEFEDIGKKIAKKCNGLPLAARTLGSVLRNKSSLEEWKVVLHNDVWEMKEAEIELFPHLLLSYNELSPTLKRCFSYCVVYPKDSNINVEELIGNWMALGYLGNDTTNIEGRGREYFDILTMHSLFQDIVKDEYNGEILCKMHDIVHDFAQFLRKSSRAEATSTNKCATCGNLDPSPISSVNEFRSLFPNYKGSLSNPCNCLTRLRVLNLRGHNLKGIPQIIENFIHLRLLNLHGNRLSCADLKIIFKLYNLKTLNLGHCRLKEIPTEIEKLIHLRNLNLRSNTHLEKLPETMRGLHKLRTLNVENCLHLGVVPNGLAVLTSLSSLTEFKGDSTWSKLGLLKNSTHLLGRMVSLIIILGGHNDLKGLVEDIQEIELRSKTHIENLDIIFVDEMDEKVESFSSRVRKDVIDALDPHPNLLKLQIKNYKGSKLPGWIVSPLNQLRDLFLYKCHHLTALPSLGKLSCLEQIRIIIMERLEMVGREFLGFPECSSDAPVISFPKLKILRIEGCGKWKEWEDITAEEEASSACSVMPCLKELEIQRCDGLTALPHRLLRKMLSLVELNISGSTQLQQRYEDKDGSDWKSISQNNPRLQLIVEDQDSEQ